MTFTLRKATMDDVDAIEAVMRDSLSGIGSRSYDDRQIASSLEHIAHIDRHLIGDGTYFVAVADGEVVGCGGWSRRGKLFSGPATSADAERLLDPATEAARVRAMFVTTRWARRGIGRSILERCEEEAFAGGFRKVELMAMLSGEAMYAACGYSAVENVQPQLADGTALPLTRMVKTIERAVN
jgi:N-acetylglutamate synthase-like GNAT family acetyltransferase